MNIFKGLSIISSLIVIAGVVLMFSSISLGNSLGDSWLNSQEDDIADSNRYNMIVETYKNNFVIIGSILFGAGYYQQYLLTIHMYFSVKRKSKIYSLIVLQLHSAEVLHFYKWEMNEKYFFDSVGVQTPTEWS